MKFSYNWLRDLLPDLAASPAEVASKLTLHSFEAEVGAEISLPPEVIAARITNLQAHPNADRLRLATIDTGRESVTVVCGAANISAGDTVPYAPPGTKLRDNNGRVFTLRAAQIRGVTSPGMLASLRELGLGSDHGGIWQLPAATKIGTALASLFPADTVIELDLTPNRTADCASHLGLAREVAALFDTKLREPQLPALPTLPADIKVDLENPADCPRYLGVVLSNFKIAPSPLWLQARLLAAGAKPINNLVDISNYVMFESGNPTHLFDYERLGQPARLHVRSAKSGEAIELIDAREVLLEPGDLVITAGQKPIALAGIMGSLASGVSGQTTTALLEVANFRAFAIQQTAHRLNLRTEASQRFSKKLEPARVELAARRAIALLSELAGARPLALTDNYPRPRPAFTIAFDPRQPAALAGTKITPAFTSRALESLRFTIAKSSSDQWQVTPPADRLDIALAQDISEEVIRLFGLDNITAAKLTPSQPAAWPHHIFWREVVRETLAKLGFSETYNPSFAPRAYTELLGLKVKPLSVANPPAPELANLRASLLPGLLKCVSLNRELLHRGAGRKESALFEIGHIYLPAASPSAPAAQGRVPGVYETEYLAGVIIGDAISLPEVATAIAQALSLDQVNLPNIIPAGVADKLKFRLPLQAFEIELTQLIQSVDSPAAPAPTVQEIQQRKTAAIKFAPLPRHPAAYRDLSMIVAPGVSIEQIQAIMERVGGPLVADVDLFDIYDLTPNQRSLAFHLTYQAHDRTLKDDEVSALHNRIIATLKQELDLEIRD